MKKKSIVYISIIMALVLAALSITVAYAETLYVNAGYTYAELNDTDLSIRGWDNRTSDLVIPENFGSGFVYEIGDMAFMNNNEITSVDFSQASNLKRIGIMAFKGCTSLGGGVYIPAQVSTVGLGSFQGCTSIENIDYSAVAPIGAQAFYQCSSLDTVVISDGTTAIGRLAFAECPALTWIRIPSSVGAIDSTAFRDSANVVIYCYTDSYAHQYAVDNGIDYVLIDAPTDPTDPTEPTTVTEATVATEVTTPTETEATVATETEPTTATSAPEGYILGDADGSGNVDIVDATFVQRFSIKADVPIDYKILIHGDVDRDGELEITDATFIMRRVIRAYTPYPIGEFVS